MRIAFVVNNIKTEQHVYSTTRMAMTAVNMGHEVWMLSVSDFVYDPDGSIKAHARTTPRKKASYRSTKSFLQDIQNDGAKSERITVDDIDVLLLRNDPAEDAGERPWAQTSGILFGQLAVSRGVIVLNDPVNLANALNKTYFQHFPDELLDVFHIAADARAGSNFVREVLKVRLV